MKQHLSTKQIIRDLKTELEQKLRENYVIGMDPARKEYPLDYKKLRNDLNQKLNKNPRCDAWLYSKKFDELVILEFEMKGCATWTAAKLWFYVKNGGRFDELQKAPRNVKILHLLSNGLTKYDVFVAKELGDKLNKELKKNRIGEYIPFPEAFDLRSNLQKIVGALLEIIVKELIP